MTDKAAPAFAGKLRTESYYITTDATIRSLRRTVTNREMAERLNAKNMTTPSGKVWDRQRVAQYIRSRAI
ncbi:hypothetical protein NM04_11215 [Massilia aurea]|uniref:Recombinase domain-containing protein n=1 Tax=Massilia aurea TaxID=373040 RepID=A0A422QL63_9BURK|nr:hypothetical protein [Massilia aurea]RNF30683.1 hypothetical protein NM04_11215 [Massilia aurea]